MLNHNLRGRGTWHRAWQIARQWARRGHEVTLWTAAPEHWYRAVGETVEGVQVVETPSWAIVAPPDDGWGLLDVAWRMKEILKRRYDLCYAFAHPPNVYYPARLLQLLGRTPLLYDWCDWYEGGVFPRRREMRLAGLSEPPGPSLQAACEGLAIRHEIRLERRIPRRAGRVTVISELLYEQTLATGKRPGEILLLPNGANLDTVTPLDRSQARGALEVPHGLPCLGYVANYHPDQQMFLEAFALACQRIPNLTMLMAGPPFGGDTVHQLGIAGNIRSFGWVNQETINQIIGASDAMVMPFEDTPFNRSRVPFKFSDYLAGGRAIITNPVGDIAQYYRPGVAPIGIAALPHAEAFGEAMAQCFSPACDLVTMGANARTMAEEKLDWSQLVDSIDTFLEQWAELQWQA